jgi:hypothetical protein
MELNQCVDAGFGRLKVVLPLPSRTSEASSFFPLTTQQLKMGPHNGRHTPPSPDFSPAAKRQKIPVACDSCRARKVRCDGDRPICRQCIRGRKNYTCTYSRQLPEAQQRYIQERTTKQCRTNEKHSTEHRYCGYS